MEMDISEAVKLYWWQRKEDRWSGWQRESIGKKETNKERDRNMYVCQYNWIKERPLESKTGSEEKRGQRKSEKDRQIEDKEREGERMIVESQMLVYRRKKNTVES